MPAGYGLTSLNPPTAVPCTNNTYGGDTEREVVADSTCQPCGANMFTNDTLTGVAATEPYTVEEDCLVAPGWGRSGEQIIRCELGTYSLGFHREACETCPTATTTFAVGADSEDLCWTQPGWYTDNTTNIAAPCDKGTYSTGGTALNHGAECVACPIGFTTMEDESVNSTDCSSECRDAPARLGACAPACQRSGAAASGLACLLTAAACAPALHRLHARLRWRQLHLVPRQHLQHGRRRRGPRLRVLPGRHHQPPARDQH